MQLILEIFGRVFHLKLSSYPSDEDEATEVVCLDGPSFDLAEDEDEETARLPFGFSMECKRGS